MKRNTFARAVVLFCTVMLVIFLSCASMHAFCDHVDCFICSMNSELGGWLCACALILVAVLLFVADDRAARFSHPSESGTSVKDRTPVSRKVKLSE